MNLRKNATGQVLSKLVRDGKVEQHARGSYVFRATKNETKKVTYSNLYEFLGLLSDGSVIMRNEEGGLERFTKQ